MLDRHTTADYAGTPGFPGTSNFSVFFRKASGMPPGARRATVTVDE